MKAGQWMPGFIVFLNDLFCVQYMPECKKSLAVERAQIMLLITSFDLHFVLFLSRGLHCGKAQLPINISSLEFRVQKRAILFLKLNLNGLIIFSN
jgi:hypothetical protein